MAPLTKGSVRLESHSTIQILRGIFRFDPRYYLQRFRCPYSFCLCLDNWQWRYGCLATWCHVAEAWTFIEMTRSRMGNTHLPRRIQRKTFFVHSFVMVDYNKAWRLYRSHIIGKSRWRSRHRRSIRIYELYWHMQVDLGICSIRKI